METSQLFFSWAALTTLVLSASIPQDSRGLSKRSDCSDGPWAGPYRIGGDGTTGGTDYCVCRTQPGKSNDIVTGLDIFVDDDWGIEGIQFTWSNGDQSLIGGHSEDVKSLQFNAHERVTSLSLWGDGEGQNLGYIYLETDQGNTLQGGKNMDPDEYKINVGGGIILGSYGFASDDGIYAAAFLFLESEIDHIEVGNLNYDKSPMGSQDGLETVSLVDTYMGNEPSQKDDISVTAAITKTETETVSHEQSISFSFGMHAEVEISGEPLGVGAKVSGGWEWTLGTTTTTTMTTTNTITLQDTIEAKVAPGHGVHCWMSVEKGEGDFPYTSDVTLFLKDGNRYSYTESGVAKSVAYSRVDGACEPNDDQGKWQGNQDSPPAGLSVKKLATAGPDPDPTKPKPSGKPEESGKPGSSGKPDPSGQPGLKIQGPGKLFKPPTVDLTPGK